MNSIGRACLTGCLLACAHFVTAEAQWSSPIFRKGTTAADLKGSCDCIKCDQQIVNGLLEQLGIAQRQNKELRDQLHRQKYHRPIVIAHPLSTEGGAAWKLLSTMLAVLCLAMFTHNHGSKARTHMRYRELQQALQVRESQWRQEVARWQTKCNQQLVGHQQQETVWKRGIKQLGHLLQQSIAAQQSKDELVSLQQVGICSDQATRHVLTCRAEHRAL